ncbi:MAG TPA: gluconate 2-dehydrogenase subunit 3 family protein [Pedobacter sp.]|jgi:hypothetical protein
MDRREAVKSVAFLMGGALSATTLGVFLDSCSSPSANKGSNLFSAEQDQIITEVADIIIPSTKTPGAKAAGVGPFISKMVRECYPDEAQKAFVKGLEDLEDRSKKEFDNSFLKISVKQREQLLGKLREETIAAQKAEDAKVKSGDPAKEVLDRPMEAKDKYPKSTPYFFAIVRDLTLLGYFTSEIGASQAMEYVHIPGRYDGCVDLKPGQRAYS